MLHCDSESIVKSYYSYQSAKPLTLSLDYRRIQNPGYNRPLRADFSEHQAIWQRLLHRNPAIAASLGALRLQLRNAILHW